MTPRRFVLALAGVLLVVAPACGLVTGKLGQEGSPALANESADAFLRALVRKDVDYAWSHLTEDTQQRVYAGNQQTFTATSERQIGQALRGSSIPS